MMLSNTFATRMLGILLPQTPTNKKELLDSHFESDILKMGAHQLLVDVSRCCKLSTRTFKNLSVCRSLLYLDVSYTQINNIDPIVDNCEMLRGLNVSGVNVIDGAFTRVRELSDLEVLLMRLSNVTHIDWMEDLCKLRSLDLGETHIHSIDSLGGHTRLEELALDRAHFELRGSELDFLDVFYGLSSLLLLNICETELARHAEKIRNAVGHDMYIEKVPRRTSFFSAVAANDHVAVHRFITSGMPLDHRAQPADELMMLKLWKTRLVVPKIKCPFFLCSSADPEQRPTALHFAVLFNARECFELLLDNGADADLSVWFGDVKEERKLRQLVENPPAEPPHTLFSVRQLVDMCFFRNVHRLTEDMYHRKVANWKTLTTMLHKRLLHSIQQTPGSERITDEALDLRGTFHLDAAESAPIDEDGNVVFGESSKAVSAPRTRILATALSTARAAADAAPDTEFSVQLGSEKVGSAGTASAPASPSRGKSVKFKSAPVDEDEDGECGFGDSGGAGGNGGGGGGGEDGKSKKSHKDKKFNDKILPRKRHLYGWRDHAMAQKLLATPQVFEVAVPVATGLIKSSDLARQKAIAEGLGSVKAGESEKESWTGGAVTKNEVRLLPVLGRKTFWLESRRLVIQQREEEYGRTVHLPAVHAGLVSRHMGLARSIMPTEHTGHSDSDEEDKNIAAAEAEAEARRESSFSQKSFADDVESTPLGSPEGGVRWSDGGGWDGGESPFRKMSRKNSRDASAFALASAAAPRASFSGSRKQSSFSGKLGLVSLDEDEPTLGFEPTNAPSSPGPSPSRKASMLGSPVSPGPLLRRASASERLSSFMEQRSARAVEAQFLPDDD
ncbi:hypothetical protein B484DRAFT_447332 [Ochromonadaceae sp. CCMP2298]|nr:hypothetical protein B484DRAFT_447332 [Ochromonadaceae sp. CCMP2298]